MAGKWKIGGLFDERVKRTIWLVYDQHTLRFYCKTWEAARLVVVKHAR